MIKSTAYTNVQPSSELLQEIAVILARGYLRLLRIQRPRRKEIGQFDKKRGQESSHN